MAHPPVSAQPFRNTTLRSVLDRSGPLAPTAAVTIAANVAALLNRAHENRYLVTPSNIGFDGEGRLYLVHTGDSVETDVDHAKADYLAPEIILPNTAPISAATEVYALARLVNECLNGPGPRPARATRTFAPKRNPSFANSQLRWPCPARDTVIRSLVVR